MREMKVMMVTQIKMTTRITDFPHRHDPSPTHQNYIENDAFVHKINKDSRNDDEVMKWWKTSSLSENDDNKDDDRVMPMVCRAEDLFLK